MQREAIRLIKQNTTDIARLKARQDTTYDDSTVVSAINLLANKVATLETQVATLSQATTAEAATLPRWFSSKLTSDVPVTDVAGATNLLTLSFSATGGQLLLIVQIGAILASANNTAGQLDFKLNGSIVLSETFTLRNQEVFAFSDFAVTTGGGVAQTLTFAVDLTTTTVGRTLTVLGSEVPSFVVVNDCGV